MGALNRASYGQVQQNSQARAASGRRDDCPSDLTIAITAGNGVLAPCCGTMIRPAQREEPKSPNGDYAKQFPGSQARTQPAVVLPTAPPTCCMFA